MRILGATSSERDALLAGFPQAYLYGSRNLHRLLDTTGLRHEARNTEALALSAEAARLSTNLNNTLLKVELHLQQAQCMALHGHASTEQALVSVNALTSLAGGTPAGAIEILRNRADFLVRLGAYEEALSEVSQSIQVADQCCLPGKVAMGNCIRARALAGMGRKAEALALLLKCIEGIGWPRPLWDMSFCIELMLATGEQSEAECVASLIHENVETTGRPQLAAEVQRILRLVHP
jgi:tetratricopeptide (TPR) repeat protein